MVEPAETSHRPDQLAIALKTQMYRMLVGRIDQRAMIMIGDFVVLLLLRGENLIAKAVDRLPYVVRIGNICLEHFASPNSDFTRG